MKRLRPSVKVPFTGIPYLAKVGPLPLEDAYPFRSGDTVLVLCEIDQMPGHVAVAMSNGKIIYGYHIDHFSRLAPEEC